MKKVLLVTTVINAMHCLSPSYASMNPNEDDNQKENHRIRKGLDHPISSNTSKRSRIETTTASTMPNEEEVKAQVLLSLFDNPVIFSTNSNTVPSITSTSAIKPEPNDNSTSYRTAPSSSSGTAANHSRANNLIERTGNRFQPPLSTQAYVQPHNTTTQSNVLTWNSNNNNTPLNPSTSAIKPEPNDNSTSYRTAPSSSSGTAANHSRANNLIERTGNRFQPPLSAQAYGQPHNTTTQSNVLTWNSNNNNMPSVPFISAIKSESNDNSTSYRTAPSSSSGTAANHSRANNLIERTGNRFQPPLSAQAYGQPHNTTTQSNVLTWNSNNNNTPLNPFTSAINQQPNNTSTNYRTAPSSSSGTAANHSRANNLIERTGNRFQPPLSTQAYVQPHNTTTQSNVLTWNSNNNNTPLNPFTSAINQQPNNTSTNYRTAPSSSSGTAANHFRPDISFEDLESYMAYTPTEPVIETSNHQLQTLATRYRSKAIILCTQGRIKSKTGKKNEADVYFKQAIRYCDAALQSSEILDQDKSIVFTFRGSANYDLNNFPAAIIDFNQALQISEISKNNKSSALSHRGMAHYYLNDLPAAIIDFNQALQISEIDSIFKTMAFNGKGLIEFDSGKYPQALGYFNQTLQIQGISEQDRAIAFAHRGLSLYKTNNFFTALPDLKEASKLDAFLSSKQLSQIHTALGVIYDIKSKESSIPKN